MMVNVNKHYDLMLGFKTEASNEQINTEGKVYISIPMHGELIIPTGPVEPHGMINYKRYLVRAAITPGIP